MTTEPSSNRPTHRVYAVIIKKEGGAKGAWLEIGAACALKTIWFDADWQWNGSNGWNYSALHL